ncbi:hypothetical protein SK128_025094, partial [Halocaridina rubra]
DFESVYNTFSEAATENVKRSTKDGDQSHSEDETRLRQPLTTFFSSYNGQNQCQPNPLI